MKRIQILLYAIFVLTTKSFSQDFKKVIEIVGGMEASLKKMIANEEQSRRAGDDSLKADIAALKKTLSSGNNEVAANAKSVLERLEKLETSADSARPNSNVSEMARQLNQLIGELKKVIAQSAMPYSGIKDGKQAQWSGEARFRSEVDGRDFKLNTPMNTYTLSRIRLGAEVKPVDRVTVKITIQDSRTFGQEASTIANSANIDLYEGYVKIDSLFRDDVSIKLGRMVLAYGNERILGGLGWQNYGRVFDGLLVRHACEKMMIDFLAMNIVDVNTAPPSVNATGTAYKYDNGVALYGFYSTIKFIENLPFDFYVLHERNQNYSKPDTIDYGFTTIGGLVKGKMNAISYDVEAAYQLGSNKGVDVSAYTAAAMVGYSMQGSTLSMVSAHADIISGTSPTGKEYNTFTVNYSTAHKFYGYMDYFINFPVQTFNRGLMDLYVRAGITWNDNAKTQVTAHNFTTMEDFSATAPLNKKDLGQEVDLVTNYKYNKVFGFECGVGAFIPNTLIRTSFGGSDIGVWSYFTTQVNF